MNKLLKRSKRFFVIACAFALVMCSNIMVYAAETPANTMSTEAEIISFQAAEVTSVQPRSYHTFYQFPKGTYYGATSFDFSTTTTCVLKFMYVAKYTDGTTGTFTYTKAPHLTTIYVARCIQMKVFDSPYGLNVFFLYKMAS